MRVLLRVSLFALLMGSAAWAQEVYNLPQVANGGGLIQTTFIGFNNGDTTANVVLTLRGDDGSLLPMDLSGLGTNSVHMFVLEPGETRFLQSTGQGPIQVGAAQVISTTPIGFSAVFSLLQPDGSIRTEAGVGASPGVNEFAIAVDSTGVFNTGIALQNLGGSSNPVTFTLFETQPAGVSVPQGGAPQAMRTLPDNGHLSVFFSGPGGLFPDAGSTRGVMLVQAQSEVAGLTLRQGRGGAPLTTLPAVPTNLAQTDFTLPQVANGTGIRTQFILFGLGGGGPAGAAAATVNITLFDDDGNPFSLTLSNGQTGSSFDISVGPTEAVFLETSGTGTPRAGAARVTSDRPIGLTAVFSLVNAAGAVTTEAGIGDSPAFSEFTIPVDLTSGFNTGLALFNGNDSAATLALQFIGEDGSTAEAEFRLDPKSSTAVTPQGVSLNLGAFNHLARFVPQLIPGVAGVRGQLSVVADLAVAALTLRQGPTTLTSLPVAEGVADTGGGPGPMGTELLRSSVTGVNATANVVVDRVLDGGFRLEGRITIPPRFFPSSLVAIRTNGDVFSGSVDFFGNYLIIVPAGTFDIRICSLGTSGPASEAAPAGVGGGSVLFLGQTFQNIEVNADTSRNFVLNGSVTRTVSGTLSNLGALPPDSLTSLVFTDESNLRSVIAGVEEGVYSAAVPPGTYQVGVYFSVGLDTNNDGIPDEFIRAGAILGLGQVVVGGGPVVANFAFPAVSEVTGVISQPQTPMLPEGASALAVDAQLPVGSFLEQCFPAIGASFTLAAPDGTYDLLVARNRSYSLAATLPITSVGTNEEGIWMTPLPGTGARMFPADEVVNIAFPDRPALRTVNGRVTDRNGTPVQGVDVSVSTLGGVTGAANTAFSASTTTGPDGRYDVQVLSGTNYTVVFDPPPPGS